MQRVVLEFAKKHILIEAAQVRVWAKKELDKDISLKRIHDAISRLVARGIIEKVSRGVYRLTEFGKKLLSMMRGKETECCVSADASSPSSTPTPDFTRVRLHFVGSNIEDFVKRLVFAKKVIDCALRFVKSVIGKSIFYKIARSVSVDCIDFFIGGHGFSSFVGRSSSRPLINLEFFDSLGLSPREVGIDIFAITNVSKLFAKMYIG